MPGEDNSNFAASTAMWVGAAIAGLILSMPFGLIAVVACTIGAQVLGRNTAGKETEGQETSAQEKGGKEEVKDLEKNPERNQKLTDAMKDPKTAVDAIIDTVQHNGIEVKQLTKKERAGIEAQFADVDFSKLTKAGREALVDGCYKAIEAKYKEDKGHIKMDGDALAAACDDALNPKAVAQPAVAPPVVDQHQPQQVVNVQAEPQLPLQPQHPQAPYDLYQQQQPAYNPAPPQPEWQPPHQQPLQPLDIPVITVTPPGTEEPATVTTRPRSGAVFEPEPTLKLDESRRAGTWSKDGFTPKGQAEQDGPPTQPGSPTSFVPATGYPDTPGPEQSSDKKPDPNAKAGVETPGPLVVPAAKEVKAGASMEKLDAAAKAATGQSTAMAEVKTEQAAAAGRA